MRIRYASEPSSSRREMPGSRLTEREPQDQEQRAGNRHLHRGRGIDRNARGVTLGVDRPHRPRCSRQREGDRPPHFGREDLVRRHSSEETDADEPRQESDSHLPRESGLSARDHRIEEGGPERTGRDVHARESRWHRLLGPHDDRVAADEQEGPADAENLPFARGAGELSAGREHGAGEQNSGREESCAREEEGRQIGHADADGEVGGAPHHAHEQVGDERATAESRHAYDSSPAGTIPDFSKTDESTMVVRVLTGSSGPRSWRMMRSSSTSDGAATLRT